MYDDVSPHPDSRIVMVTGAFPPDVCGVGDYTDRLMAAAPSSWGLLVARDWSWRSAPNLVRRLLASKPAGIVIQYPTQGYGWSLLPHLLVLIGRLTGRYRAVLALHEFTSLSRKARLALALTSHFAAHIVFTTEAERTRAQASPLFSSSVASSIIGILSNIPQAALRLPFNARSTDIAYFGHIRPNKGLEAFLDVMIALRRVYPTLQIKVIGEVPLGYEAFAEMVAHRCRAIDATMMLGLDDEAVACTLADVRILYLPFPDGASARRGSLLAGLANGALIATRTGDATPTTLLPALIACSGGEADVAVLSDALRYSDVHAELLQRQGYEYLARILPRDWKHVAALYGEALERALR